MNIKTKQAWSVVLSIVGSLGTVGAVLLARNASKKEDDIRRDIFLYEEKKGVKLSKKEKFKQIAPLYIPTAAVGVITISSIISSTILNRKTEASLIAMAAIADQGWRKYKKEVKELIGVDKDLDVVKSIAKKTYKKVEESETETEIPYGTKLYYEEHIGYFYADPELLMVAYSDINKKLNNIDHSLDVYQGFYATLYDLIKKSEAKLLDPNIDPESFKWGWSYEYLMESFGSNWVNIEIVPMEDYDEVSGNYISYSYIKFNEEPIVDPEIHPEEFKNYVEELDNENI